MSKVAVVYWTQSGNTEAMANVIAEAVQAEAVECSAFSADSAGEYDAFAFGCPAMGAEELDPDLEELFNECVPNMGDKPVVLFGSYDWGSGEWMDEWRSAAEGAGVNVVETVICNLEPDGEAEEALRQAAAKLA